MKGEDRQIAERKEFISAIRIQVNQPLACAIRLSICTGLRPCLSDLETDLHEPLALPDPPADDHADQPTPAGVIQEDRPRHRLGPKLCLRALV